MNNKLIINLQTGQLEVEGSESLIKEIYKDFKDLLSKSPGGNKNDNNGKIKEDKDTSMSTDGKKNKSNKAKVTKPKASTNSKPKGSNEMKFLTELNLRPRGKESLKDFAAKYQIKTAEELSLLIVYYLKEFSEEKVTIAHIFTCMKELGKKIPTHLKQVLTNSKNNKNWIDLSDWDDIKYTVAGMNYMEHDFVKL